MYPFLTRCASASFFTLALTLLGCSAGPSRPPVSVSLNNPEITKSAKCHNSRRAGDAIIYECESELGPVFVTTVKDCSIPEKFTFQATTRQLLVGVMDLTVISQEPVTLNNQKALHSIVHGTMDVDPFLMSIYTFHQNDCVTDLVVWTGSTRSKPSPADTSKFSAASSNVAEHIVGTLIPSKEQPRAAS